MTEINRYISFIKGQAVNELSGEELSRYLEFIRDNSEIEQYISRMKVNKISLELENSILENRMNIEWLGDCIEKIVKNDLKEVLNNKKILEYIKKVNGRNNGNDLSTIQ